MWNVPGTRAPGASKLCITDTGNMVLSAPNGKTVWSSGTGRPNNASGPYHINIVEGNLVIKDGNCRSIWMAPTSEWLADGLALLGQACCLPHWCLCMACLQQLSLLFICSLHQG